MSTFLGLLYLPYRSLIDSVGELPQRSVDQLKRSERASDQKHGDRNARYGALASELAGPLQHQQLTTATTATSLGPHWSTLVHTNTHRNVLLVVSAPLPLSHLLDPSRSACARIRCSTHVVVVVCRTDDAFSGSANSLRLRWWCSPTQTLWRPRGHGQSWFRVMYRLGSRAAHM